MMRPLLLLCLLLAGCAGPLPQQPDRVFENARLQFRQGKFQEALAQVGQALKEFGSRPEPAWRARFLLLESEILLALEQPEKALKTLDSTAPPGQSSPEFRARWCLFRGRAKTLQRKFQEASGLLDEAFRLASETGSPAVRSEVELMRTYFFFRRQEWTPAEASARNALEHAQRSGDTYLEAAAFKGLGNRWMFNSRFDEAVPWYEKSIAVSERNGYRFISATVRHNLGICYFRLGDYDKALQLFAQVEREYVEIGDVVGQEKCAADMGNVHLHRGDLTVAISSYRKALALARQLKDDDDIWRWQSNLAMASLETGDLDSAEASMREALALLEKIRDDQGTVWAFLNSAGIAAGRGRIEEAEGVYRQTIASATKLGMTSALLQARAKLGSLYLRAGDPRKAEGQFRVIVSEGESSRSRLARDEWKLTFQSSVIPFYEDYIEFLMSRGRVDEALEVAESCRARLLAEKLGLDRKSVKKATVATFRAKARAERAVLLSYWLAPRRSFLWVVTPDRVHSFNLPPEKQISPLVEAYTNAILQVRDPIETLNAAGSKLFEALVAPARKLVGPEANVIIVPDGSLYELNFETLPAPGERLRYWIEEATVTIAPSLAVLQPAARSAENGRLLLLGSPASPAPEYPPLPASEVEVAKIQDLFRAEERTVVTGPQAHPGAYEEAGPGSFSLIHFSAHAVANRESPLDSAVILSRKQDSYKLYARDVAALPLRANLVTISACRSAGARTYSGEGLVGFAWAFLQAGASNVIAGLWDVADRSTSDLMIQLYAGLANGMGPAEALRSAKLTLVRSNSAYRKPYYWAPFQLYTRSTPFLNRP